MGHLHLRSSESLNVAALKAVTRSPWDVRTRERVCVCVCVWAGSPLKNCKSKRQGRRPGENLSKNKKCHLKCLCWGGGIGRYFHIYGNILGLEGAEWKDTEVQQCARSHIMQTCPAVHMPEGFRGGTVVQDLPASAGAASDMGSTPESGRPRRVANGTQLQYSCLENPMDRGVWQATVHGAAKNQIWLSTRAHARTYTHKHTHTHHMPYKWLSGCACKENTCYAGRRLEHKPSFWMGFGIFWVFFLGIHLMYVL